MKGHKGKAGSKVTLPFGDTVPAPGSYEAGVLNMENGEMPVVDTTGLVDAMGAGTAEDKGSVTQAPLPEGHGRKEPARVGKEHRRP